MAFHAPGGQQGFVGFFALASEMGQIKKDKNKKSY
jgi:hypothetical protein